MTTSEERELAIQSMIHDEKCKFMGRDAIILTGKFKGRLGKITSVIFDRNGFAYLVQPYRRSGDGNELLWLDPILTARSYTTRKGFHIYDEEDDIRKEYYPWWYEKMCKEYGKEEVDKNWSFEDCLEDWIATNYARVADE